MNMNQSKEDYLETIYILEQEKQFVRPIDISNQIGFSKPSVTNAMKKLKDYDYIDYDEKGHILLTDSGRELARYTYEKHCFFKELLMDVGVSEETASIDACKMEHAISKETFEILKKNWKKDAS